jgi:heme oxygenase
LERTNLQDENPNELTRSAWKAFLALSSPRHSVVQAQDEIQAAAQAIFRAFGTDGWVCQPETKSLA